MIASHAWSVISHTYDSISRMSFQKLAQEFQLEPCGLSTRWQVIGCGNVVESSVEENQATPGRIGDEHTHPPSDGRDPNFR